jgi:WD repeat-containing protein 19
VAVSARPYHIDQELYQSREFSNILNDMSISSTLNRIALIGDDSVKFKDTENLKLPIKSIVVSNENAEFASWSEDGRILAVSSSETGRVYAYMTKLPNSCAVFGPYLLILAGFKKLELYRKSKPGSMSELKIDKEADFLHIGPSYLGFGLGNRVWYFFYEERNITMVTEKNYNGVVVDVLTNIEYTAVSCSDKVYIHKVESVENDEIQVYPKDQFANFSITAHALTSTCLIYSLENGNIHFINVTEAVEVATLNHHCGIVELSVNPTGYLTCFQDTCGNTFIHDFVTNELTKLELKNIDSFLWEHGEFRRKIFVTVLDKTAKYFAYQVINSHFCLF